MQTMSDKVLAIYCFLDDFFLKTKQTNSSKNSRCSDSAIVTTALIAACYFYGNQASAMRYMQEKEGFAMLDKSGFNRRLHALTDQLEALFYYLASFFKDLNVEKVYIIDSFPVPICDNIRINRSRLVKEDFYRGKLASKHRFFYGYRVQLITTLDGQAVQYLIHPGAFSDIRAFRAMDLDLPFGSEVYADSAYTDYQLEDTYADCEQIYLRVQRKKSALRVDQPYWVYLKKHIRQKIEQTFSQITARFPKHIHAVTAKGFILKIVLFLLIHNFDSLL